MCRRFFFPINLAAQSRKLLIKSIWRGIPGCCFMPLMGNNGFLTRCCLRIIYLNLFTVPKACKTDMRQSCCFQTVLDLGTNSSSLKKTESKMRRNVLKFGPVAVCHLHLAPTCFCFCKAARFQLLLLIYSEDIQHLSLSLAPFLNSLILQKESQSTRSKRSLINNLMPRLKMQWKKFFL